MSSSRPVALGVAGIGGYARAVADTVRKHGPEADPSVHLAAVCDPALGEPQHAQRVAELAGEGVATYPSLEAMLAEADIEAVWLPVPIALHASFTEQALAAGKAVMCEKPAAGTVDEVDAMIAARDRAERPALIGFQSVYASAAAEVKRRLLDGAIGPVVRAVVHGYWPRSDHYFARTDWAGRLRHGERWVLDSPLQNAMSHYVNLPLFLLGASFEGSATPQAIEAELYRAAPIENYDTLSARLWLPRTADEAGEADANLAGAGAEPRDGIPMLVLLTHATAGSTGGPWVRIEGERGTVTWSARVGAVIENAAGCQTFAVNHDGRFDLLQSFARVARGRSVEPLAVATLESARAHTVTVNGASASAPVVSVPTAAVERITTDTGEVFHTIADIAATFDRCAEKGTMLHESGAYGFTYPAQLYDLRGYSHFAGPHAGTASAAEPGSVSGS